MSGKAYTTYVVKQGDTIEGIAQEKLGDWSRWREIAALNDLRYPFVSDRPDQWFGNESVTGILAVLVQPGSLGLYLPGERATNIPPGSTLLLEGFAPNDSGNNVQVYDVLKVLEYNQVSGVLSLDGTATKYQWQEGTRFRIFPPDLDQTAHVARPGQRILLPIFAGDIGSILDTAFAATLYGSDVSLENKGKMTLESGDLATVSGLKNIYQALRFRAELPYGSFILHTDEGNRCHELLGEAVKAETTMRAAAFVREALETDPRILGVTEVEALVPQADTIAIAATAVLAQTQEQVSINTLLRNRQ